jgi:hypothetical protein
MAQSNPEMDQVVADLLAGLRKLPVHRGLSFRGGGVTDTFGRSSRTAVTRALTATSRDPRVATENFTTGGLYAVIGSAGRDVTGVSEHPAEREVVFLPDTAFRVVRTVRHEDLPIVVVEQLDPDRAPTEPKLELDSVLQRIATLVRAAKDADPVEVTSPGKFAGDID